MNIVMATDSYPSSRNKTAAAFVHARAKAYLDAGQSLLVITTPTSDNRGEEYRFEGVRVLPASALSRTCEEISRLRPDIVCVHAPEFASLSMKLGHELVNAGYRCISWIHGYEALVTALHGYYHSHPLRALASLPRDWLRLTKLREFLKRCDAVVYVSNWMRTAAERYTRLRHPHAHVVPNPVDTTKFIPAQGRTPLGELRGLSVRSLTNPKYGLDIAIRAFAGIRGATLTIVGQGRLARGYKQLIRKLNAPVTIEEASYPHDAMPRLYQQFDFFVAPSRTEAQGLTMCEAMSCGLPVVATSVGGIPEFVRDGIDGFLARTPTSSALRRAVLHLLEKQQQLNEMGLRARQNIVATCSSADVVRRDLDIMESVRHNESRVPDSRFVGHDW